MVRMSSGIQDTSLTFLSRAGVLAIAMGYQSCLAWLLGPAGRGSYAICILFVTLLTLTVSFSSRIALEYFVASRKLNLSEGVTYGLVSCLITWLLAASVATALAFFQLSFFSKASPESFRLAVLLLPLLFIPPLLLQLLCSIRQFRWFAVFSISQAVFQLALALIFLNWLDLGVNGALLATGFSATVSSLLILVFMRKAYRISLVKPSIGRLKEIVRFGSRYYVGNISNQVNMHVGTVILAFLVSPAEIGLFALAAQLMTQIEMVPNAVGSVLMPRIATDKGGRRDLVAQCSRVAFLVCGILVLALVVLATPVVRILFSAAFLPIVPLIRIIAVGVVVRCAAKVFVPYLVGTGHPGQASIAVAGGALTNLVFLWLLLPVYGLMGAAIGMAAGHMVSSVFLTYAFTRLSGLRIGETWRFRRSDWTALGQMMRLYRGRLAG
jgi:O-antigen/teichoic acid export membrane protein